MYWAHCHLSGYGSSHLRNQELAEGMGWGVMVNDSRWVLKGVGFGKLPTSGQGPPGGPSGEPGFPSGRSAKLHLELGESRQLDAEWEGQVSTEMMMGAEPSPALGKGGATLERKTRAGTHWPCSDLVLRHTPGARLDRIRSTFSPAPLRL